MKSTREMQENKLSDKEINVVLDSMCILHSRLEQKNQHILKFFNENKIENMDCNLKTGDYGLAVRSNSVFKNDYFVKDLIIERKANLNEFAKNITKKRAQFVNEMNRAAASNSKFIVMFERTPVALKCIKCNKLIDIKSIGEKCNCEKDNIISLKNDKYIYLFEDFYNEIIRSNYNSRINNRSYYATIMSWNHSKQWNNHFTFVDKDEAGRYIYNTFKYYLRSRLKSL